MKTIQYTDTEYYNSIPSFFVCTEKSHGSKLSFTKIWRWRWTAEETDHQIKQLTFASLVVRSKR